MTHLDLLQRALFQDLGHAFILVAGAKLVLENLLARRVVCVLRAMSLVSTILLRIRRKSCH